MKKRNLTLLILLLAGVWNMQAQSSTYWYVDGLPDVWYYQPDVFAFKCWNGQAFTGTANGAIVDSVVHRANRRDKAVEVYFKATASPLQRLAEVQNLFNTGQIEMPYITLTRDTLIPRTEEDWFVLDNLILVNFKVAYPDSADIDDFMNRYNLTLFSAPSADLPAKADSDYVSYTYIFEAHLPQLLTTSSFSGDYFIEICRNMFTIDTAFVLNAEPNFVNFRGADRNVSSTIAGSPLQGNYTCPTNDPLYGDMNNIENIGTNVPYSNAGQFPSMSNGTLGADPNICGCWSQGLSGAGIKVGVIGSDGYCLTQSDMASKFDPLLRWDCSSGICVPLSSSSVLGIAVSGMRIASILGQEGNNNLGAVGVAPDVTIVPYKIGGNNGVYNTGSTASFVEALKQALIDKVDVIVTDFFVPTQSSGISNEIRNHFQYGRPISPIPGSLGYGTVIIAPAGFTTNSVGSTGNFYPAAGSYLKFDDVVKIVSVIGSNRFDALCTEEIAPATGGQKYALPSHYGSQYDVAAPGPRIPAATDDAGFGGSAVYTYAYQPHTGAVATVAGIVAMTLEQFPTLTAKQVRQAIIDGAEQVGSYTYTNGISTELGHGRVNCANTINVLTTNIDPILATQIMVSVSYQSDSWLLKYDLGKFTRSRNFVKVWNVWGQELFETELQIPKSEKAISTLNYPQGVYFLSLTDENGNVYATQKVVKF